VAAAVWLALTYGVPASLLLTRAHDSVLSGVDGSWLLWVVSTQSIALTAAILVPATERIHAVRSGGAVAGAKEGSFAKAVAATVSTASLVRRA